MSAKTGRAPTRRMALAVETNVKEGQTTSWPGPMPSARRASSRACVQEVVSSTRGTPSSAASRCSTRRPKGPSPAGRPASASRDALLLALVEPGRRKGEATARGRAGVGAGSQAAVS